VEGDPSDYWNQEMVMWAQWVKARFRTALDLHWYHTSPELSEKTLDEHMQILEGFQRSVSNFLKVRALLFLESGCLCRVQQGRLHRQQHRAMQHYRLEGGHHMQNARQT
jgi:hypothetical protein